MSPQQSAPEGAPSIPGNVTRKPRRLRPGPPLCSRSPQARLSRGRAGMGAPAADRPLRHPPAWPCWSCPCWQGDPHPQRPWERNKGASRLSAAAPWCPAGAAQDGGEGGDRWGGGRPARPPRRPPASSPPGWALEQVPRPGPGAPALPHALGQPTCAGLQEQPERGQVPRQQGEEARGHAVARRPHQEAAPRRPARPRWAHKGRWLGSMPAAHLRDKDPALPGARGPPACSARSRQTARGGVVLGLPGAGSLPAARPSPPCGAPGSAAPKPVGGRAGLGAGTTKTSRGDPSGPQEDLRMRHPRPPTSPGSGAPGELVKAQVGFAGGVMLSPRTRSPAGGTLGAGPSLQGLEKTVCGHHGPSSPSRARSQLRPPSLGPGASNPSGGPGVQLITPHGAAVTACQAPRRLSCGSGSELVFPGWAPCPPPHSSSVASLFRPPADTGQASCLGLSHGHPGHRGQDLPSEQGRL